MVVGTFRSPGGSGSILLDDVRCAATSSSNLVYLDNCSKRTYHNCRHYEDVTINCFPDSAFDVSPPADPSQWAYQLDAYSRLQTRPSSVSPWGYVGANVSSVITINGSAESTLAAVACRSLGFTATTTTSVVHSYSPLSTRTSVFYWTNLHLDPAACGEAVVNATLAGAAVACRNASFPDRNVFHAEFSTSMVAASVVYVPVIRCTSRRQWQAAERDARNRGWQFRFASDRDDMDIASTTSGVLLVRTYATDPWGFVCRRSFDSAAAAAACRSLGFEVPAAMAAAMTYASYGSGNASTPITLDKVQCGAIAGEPFLAQCAYAFNPSCQTCCRYLQVVFLQCARLLPLPPPPPPPTTHTTTTLTARTTTTPPPTPRKTVKGKKSPSSTDTSLVIVLVCVFGGMGAIIIAALCIYRNWCRRSAAPAPTAENPPPPSTTLNVPVVVTDRPDVGYWDRNYPLSDGSDSDGSEMLEGIVSGVVVSDTEVPGAVAFTHHRFGHGRGPNERVPYGNATSAARPAAAAIGDDVDSEVLAPTSRELSSLYPAALPEALPVAFAFYGSAAEGRRREHSGSASDGDGPTASVWAPVAGFAVTPTGYREQALL